MRRTLASLLAATLVAAPSAVSSLHVHDYTGHDHPTHHHGPASHEHSHAPLIETDHDHDAPVGSHEVATIRPESCDPGRHTVAVKVTCAQPPQVTLDLGELPGPTNNVLTAPVRTAVGITDVRVHGPPPFDPRIPSRAPPLAFPV